MNRFSDRIYLSGAREDTDRPVTALIRGEDRTLLFDAGNSAAHAREISRDLAAAGLPQPDFIAVSHSHCDHWFGLSAFSAVSFSSDATCMKIRGRMALDWSSEAVRSRLEAGEEDEITAYMLDVEYGRDRKGISLKAPDVAFSGSVRFRLGGLECLFEHIGGDHADDSSVLFVERENVLFLGDVLYVRNFTENVIDELARRIFVYGAGFFVDSHSDRIHSRADIEKRLDEMKRSGSRG